MNVAQFFDVKVFASGLFSITACLVSGCVTQRLSGAEDTTRFAEGRTAMIYLPGTRGHPGTTVPYDLGRGRSRGSVAGLILNRAVEHSSEKSQTYNEDCGMGSCVAAAPRRIRSIAKPAIVQSSTGETTAGDQTNQRCGLQRCSSSSVTWEPRTTIIAASPKVVIGAVLLLLKEGHSITDENIRRRLESETQLNADAGVMTSIVSQRYPCQNNWDGVPNALLHPACQDQNIIEKISISGQPGSMVDGQFRPLEAGSDRHLWYGEPDLLNGLSRAGLTSTNVSNEYGIAWRGHMPPTEAETQINAACNCFAVAIIASGQPHKDVTVNIYQRVES